MSPRYIFRLIQAFLKRFKAIIFLGFVIGIIVFLFLTLLLPSMTSQKQKIGLVGRYTVDSLPTEISSKISLGLTKTDEAGNIIPGIAKSWETPDGGKTWIFKMSEGHQLEIPPKSHEPQSAEALLERGEISERWQSGASNHKRTS